MAHHLIEKPRRAASMSVIAGLAREHKIFEKLILQLEHSLAYDEETARGDIRDTLLVLLPALDIHEEIEETVFGHPSYASKEDAKLLLGETEWQHQKIQQLRMELIDALETYSKESFARLRDLVAQLARDLRLHFAVEEKRLWPHYRDFSRSLDSSIKRRLEERVRQLRQDIDARRRGIAEYLSIRR